MYHIFFIHSSIIGHLCGFHILSIVNKASMNIDVYVSFWIMIFLRVGFLGHTVDLFLVFLRNLPTVLHTDYIHLHSHL